MENSTPTAQEPHNGNNTIAGLEGVLKPENKARVTIRLNEGNDHPNLAFWLEDANGAHIARSFIINCSDLQVDFTLHLRSANPPLPITLHCETFFEDDQPIDHKECAIEAGS